MKDNQGVMMSIIKRTPIVLLFAALIIVSSGAAYAQCPGGGDCSGACKPALHGEKGPGPGPMIPDLTDDQKEQMENLHLELLKAIKPLQNQIGEKEAHLRTLQTETKANMSDINKTIEDIGQLQIKIMKLKAAQHQEIRSLLTDEQRVFFDAHRPPHDGPGGPKGQPGHCPR